MTDLISVAVESGSVELLGSFDGPRFIHQLSPDDSIVYFTSDNFPALGSVLQWNMAVQKEETLSTQLDKLETYAPSPDGNWLVRTTLSSNMSVRPMSGGDWKNLVSGATGLWWQTVVSPDSKWVFYHTIDQAGKHSLFRVSITGGEPERMGDFPCESFSGLLDMSSEGRQILATCNGGSEGNAGYDLWVLENFEPPAKK
jgi:Tol biopolymer transport system component